MPTTEADMSRFTSSCTLLTTVALALLLSACGGTPKRSTPSAPPAGDSRPAPTAPQGGGYYKDDGPDANPPANLDSIPDAVPRDEPLHRFANRPYTVFGQRYVPATALQPHRQRGVASWYGRRFHGNPTSSGEPYDMYAMTAAHPTLPIPSYARVTNVTNGRSVVVRINDRGPFLRGRIIDLSYAAAHRLGYINAGSATVEVETILPSSAVVASTAPAVTPVQPAAAGGARQAYLQLGVFSTRANAEDLRGRVHRELAAYADRVHLLADGERFRLQLGPWPNENDARRAAAEIGRTLGLQPFLVVR
ncbi:septal ring lytic transglycosylase RlpA family lipoprotein [Pseudothauera lacus]|uniref:Endolytic peptidoglycan transglycosylase RlpA n=2 Tax=Pseudothauera lacus TaxID=2136175 RepID=A0A2T4IDL1_9RHOO|nr:septal ring lytic transglycosylase RlpA family lipoprotein [Pseudothauera lacus]